MKVLFIGNSHTYFNDMPHLFAEICRENHAEVEVTMLAHGGRGWDFHLEEPEVQFNIRYGGPSARPQRSISTQAHTTAPRPSASRATRRSTSF